MKAPRNLRCDHSVSPLGVDSRSPLLSWEPDADERGVLHAGFTVLCSPDEKEVLDGRGDAWSSTGGDALPCTRYAGRPLAPYTRYVWRVRTRDEHGEQSPWSDPATFETAALAQADWPAQWISMHDPSWSPSRVLVVNDSINAGAMRDARLYWAISMRRVFTLPAAPVRARLYSCGLGCHEMLVNGIRVGDARLDPGQTDYATGALYVSHDVLPSLRTGANVLQAVLGNGRYLDAYGFGQPRLTAFLLAELPDGSVLRVVTDPRWRCAHGPIRRNGVYEGEFHDAREGLGAWHDPAYDDSAWTAAERIAGHPLASQQLPPIRVRTVLRALGLSSPRPGAYLFDFGQNLTGVVRLRLRGARGSRVEVRFAELLGENGAIDLGTNREAAACDTYVAAGTGEEVFEPRFTYHGFRYAEVTGLAEVPALDDASAIVIHTSVEQTGAFLCSDPLVNRIHENILWGQRSNLMSAPTDCPQRGERMGWLGDAQLTSAEAMDNFDMASFYVKYLEDIRLAQRPDGSLSDVVPAYWSLYPADPAWGTAYPTLVWAMWENYGDREIVARHFDGVRRYADFLDAHAEGHIVRSLGKYGDWCPPASTYPKKTPIELTSTFYYYHDTLLVARMAELLGRESERTLYADRARAIREAFNEAFLRENGRYATLAMSPIDRQPGQTSQVLPLALDIVPEAVRPEAVSVLLKTVEEIADFHVDTGIVGTRYLLDVLRDCGHAETAFRVATQRTYPGWGYMVAEGATTVWERWEKLTGQGMNSHNHIMFGTVDAWFYSTIAGIIRTSPAWRTALVQPMPLGGLTHANGRVTTPYGVLSVGWEKREGLFRLALHVPVGMTVDAMLPLPSGARTLTEAGTVLWGNGASSVHGISAVRRVGEWLLLAVGSGSYDFTVSSSGTERTVAPDSGRGSLPSS